MFLINHALLNSLAGFTLVVNVFEGTHGHKITHAGQQRTKNKHLGIAERIGIGDARKGDKAEEGERKQGEKNGKFEFHDLVLKCKNSHSQRSFKFYSGIRFYFAIAAQLSILEKIQKMFTNDTLSGKNILVTGGGSGLGLAMAKMFASLGAQVAICGRSEEKLQKAVLEIGHNAIYESCDVRDYEAVGAMMARLEERMGGINGLVNNAAGNFLSASEDLSPNAFNTVVDIVLKGTFNCTQHFGKLNIAAERRGAVVLNIVTTYTETGSAFVLPSACAKAGVYALTNSLAMEWAHYGIRLNAIAPGPFPTEGAWSRLLPDKSIEEKYMKGIPAGRYGKHEELGWLATFLMCDMSAYMTGECVTIDGGERLQAGQFNMFANLFPREQLRAFFGMMKGSRK